MLLSVTMIVKDEAALVADAVRSVHGLADEVVVYDTGSSDSTVALARQAGASVVEGSWDGDFSRARNAALALATGRWVMHLDADERWRGDSRALRRRLTTAASGEAFSAIVHNEGSGNASHWRVQFARRAGSSWEGAVHERLTGPAIRAVTRLPEEVASLLHLGYRDEATRRRKAERNAGLAQAELDSLVAQGTGDVLVVARVLFDLGRSLMGAGRKQDAVDAFETLRELAPGTPYWALGTDMLARLLGSEGHNEVVLVLAEQLREVGVDAAYCDWLAAQALFNLRQYRDALTLLRRVDRIVDPAGRECDVAPLLELRSLAAAAVGERGETVAALSRLSGLTPPAADAA